MASIITTEEFNDFSNLLFNRIDQLETLIRHNMIETAFNLEQAALKTGISVQTLRRYTKLTKGKKHWIASSKPAGKIMIKASDLEDFLKRQERGSTYGEAARLKIA